MAHHILLHPFLFVCTVKQPDMKNDTQGYHYGALRGRALPF